MESSWRQLLTLVGWGNAQFQRCARLRVPFEGFEFVLQPSGINRHIPIGCTHYDGAYLDGTFVELNVPPGRFPYGLDVYGDDVLPPPWP